MKIIRELESEVRGYVRSFPVVFRKAQGATLTDEHDRTYIDFLAGAGSLNYGHNNPILKRALLEYVYSDGVMHGLDMATEAKAGLLHAMNDILFEPRGMDYKVQFTGPTGTNAVEAAFKIARNATGRGDILSFTNGFHGVTLGAIAATANSHYRCAAGTTVHGARFVPYDGYLGPGYDTTEYLDRVLTDGSSGYDLPAAVVVETVQGEGGVNVASAEWLASLQRVCRDHDVLLIVDDIQVGCGRTGPFFSFEAMDLAPDIITLSKSLSGYGLPFAVVLMKPELDQWEPGQHNGTFRGNNMAFVTARVALEHYWQDDKLTREVARKSDLMATALGQMTGAHSELEVRGRGMIQGIDCGSGDLASEITGTAFRNGLVIETSGADNQVIKLLPPLVIEDDQLLEGLGILGNAVGEAMDVTAGAVAGVN